MSPRDLMRSSRRFPTAEEARAALDDLEKLGWGRWMDPRPHGSGGRPQAMFALVDTVDSDKTPTGGPETDGSVNVNGVNGDEGQEVVVL